ncbi:MAG: hypothetical protein RBT20_02790 [Syntrophales bacterium]|jgi:phage repressor protein C with HTH and peptisase S24 domain|nr:hypothetical protein [Syntrophales bacterium]
MIKRVQRLPAVNKIKIISNNSKYELHEADADKVKVNGKVIWFAREIER